MLVRSLRKRRKRPVGSRNRWLLVVVIAFLMLPLFAGAVGAGAMYMGYQGYSDDFVPIEEVVPQDGARLTEVYDRDGPKDGVLLGTLTNLNAPLQNPIPLERVSDHMIAATISTEDNQFWEHDGFDVRGLTRAAYENYSGGGIGTGSGGSTITQQLAKNLYLSTDCRLVDGVRSCIAPRTIDRKLRELVYAMEIEKVHSKEDILGMYLNQVSYADRYIGVQAAAENYFRKDAADLTLAESALLAGIPASPTEYHPRLNCIRETEDSGCTEDEAGRWRVGGQAKFRQEQVLDLMVRHGHIDETQAEMAKDEVVHVYPGVDESLAPAWVEGQIEPRLVRMCEAGLLPILDGFENCVDSVHSAGYQVTTTLDWSMTQQAQQTAAERISQGLDEGCNCHNAAVATIDPRSGELLVYVPNIDRENVSDERIQGDIDQLMEINQPGSALKPAIYLAWFDRLNKAPMSTIWDTSPMELGPEEGVFQDDVEIRNPRPGGGGEGLITARAGLGGSQNVPAFRAAQEASVEGVIDTAKRLGMTTLHQGFDPTFRSHEAVYYGPTIATGGSNVRAIDMAYMNATIANMGVMVGVPHLAETADMDSLESTSTAEGDAYDTALQQRHDFNRGDIRLPGTRELDPVVVLRVSDGAGNVVYEHEQPERKEVINSGSVWLLHSIMSDCTARFIVWGCGSSNEDYALDIFLDGTRIPGGVKTGTQQGPLDSSDTLETWMNGYSRYGATAVWVGNANNELVRDGPAVNYASAHATVHIYKRWMNTYHGHVQSVAGWEEPQGFDGLQPDNVIESSFRSPTTERGYGGGCYQTVISWQRTDVEYESECDGARVKLPDFKRDDAIDLARQRGILTNATGFTPRNWTPDSSGGGGGSSNNTPDPTATPAAEPEPAPTDVPEPTATPAESEPTPAPTPPPEEPEPTAEPAPDPPDGDDDNGGDGDQ